MSKHHPYGLPAPNGPAPAPAPDLRERGLRPPPGYGFWRRLWWWFDFIILVKLARLRFIAVLAAVGATIAYWDTLKAYYDKWTRPPAEQATAGADSEFWCPMHPTIVRDHPDQCPLCGMPLSKRKKGEGAHDEPLPAGVVSRVQLTPYRVALAGIRTAEVGYRRLKREVTAVGFVEFDERKLRRISARATGKSRIDRLYVNVTGQKVQRGDPLAELYSPDLVTTVQNLLDARSGGNGHLERLARDRLRLWGIDDAQVSQVLRTGRPITRLTIRSPISGYVIRKYQVEGEYVEEGTRLYDVADLSTVWVEAQVYEDEAGLLREGLPVRATTKAFPERVFTGQVAFLYPHLDSATRTLKVRFDLDNPRRDLRPGTYATVKVELPAARLGESTAARARAWRDGTAADLSAHAVLALGLPRPGGGLAPLLQCAAEEALAGKGLVLAVPERAVIDTGSRKLVYREAGPDVYEGVEVELGPRSGGFYPVLRGLEAGERVATEGSFLVDAETRLTAGAASTYFGASAGPQSDRPSGSGAAARPSMVPDEESKARAALAKLRPADRQLAEEQGYCAVLKDSRLGSMGRPVKLYLQDQPVFLCCKGCLEKARSDPERTLKSAAAQKARVKAGKAPPGARPAAPAGPKVDPEEEAEIRASLAELSASDRRLALAQRYCAVRTANRLGSMGKPVKVRVNGRPVFLCCEGCQSTARKNPEKTLATVERLKDKAKAENKRGRP